MILSRLQWKILLLNGRERLIGTCTECWMGAFLSQSVWHQPKLTQLELILISRSGIFTEEIVKKLLEGRKGIIHRQMEATSLDDEASERSDFSDWPWYWVVARSNSHIEIVGVIMYSSMNQLLPLHDMFLSSFPSKFQMSSLGEDRNQVKVSHHPSFSTHWPRPFPYVGLEIFWVVPVVGLAACF